MSFFLNRILFYFILERGEGREEERETLIFASCTPPTGDMAYILGMYPNWESNG